VESDGGFKDLRDAAREELSGLIAWYENSAKEKTYYINSTNYIGTVERSLLPKEKVIADNLAVIEMNDLSIADNIENYDLSLNVQRTLQGQLAYNFVYSANELIWLGLSKRESFELQQVSRSEKQSTQKDKQQRSDRPKLLQLFLRAFFENIRDQICVGKQHHTKQGVAETSIIASVSAMVSQHFSFDPRLSAAIAAAVILVILKAGRTSFCELTADELVSRLESRGKDSKD
jgi:hypothetical protein